MTLDRAACIAAYDRQNAQGAVKIVEDLDRYRVVLDRVQPRLIVECGTFTGHSALWFAVIGACHVVTVDIEPNVPESVKDNAGERVTWLTGSSTDEYIRAYIHGLAEGLGGPVVVVLDSDHSAPHVLTEMELYGPLVEPGSYMVVEDGVIRWLADSHFMGNFDGSPLDAIETFLSRHDGWANDEEIENMHSATQHPAGWLRRLA